MFGISVLTGVCVAVMLYVFSRGNLFVGELAVLLAIPLVSVIIAEIFKIGLSSSKEK